MSKPLALDVAPHKAIQELEIDLGLSPETIAAALGVEKRAVIRWRDGDNMPRPKVRGALAELYEIHNRLLRDFSTEGARAWMRADNRYLGGFTPEQVTRAGKPERVLEAIEALETGAFI